MLSINVIRRRCKLLTPSAIVALTLCAPITTIAKDDTPNYENLRDDIRGMVMNARDKVFPALVHIRVVTITYWGGKEHKGQSVGSGTIISSKGYVLTNQHVTDNGVKFICTLHDKQEVPAKLIGEDPMTDLAVLQLDLDEIEDAELPVAEFDDSNELQIGDQVMAMGSPFALSRSVTLGIVSNPMRVFADGSASDDVEEMELEEGQRTGLFTRWIQHDALINPGNSGGPLVNLKGRVVGVNELGGSSMGFAIPSNLARDIADKIIAHGEVPRSWIGVSFKPIDKTGYNKGVLVNSIVSDGPADEAGIEAGDLITAIDGEAVTVRFTEQVPPLHKRFADLPIGSTVKMTYERDAKEHTAEITTRKLQKDRGDEKAFRAWGLTAMEITDKLARDLRLQSSDGVLISSIRSGGPAQLAEPAMGFGDIIRAVEGDPIKDLDAFLSKYEDVMGRDPVPEHLLISYDRRGQNTLTLIKPKPEDEEDPPREVPKAWIGVATQPILTKLAEQLGHPDRKGFRITRVYPGTEAEKAGLQVGDLIYGLNGKKMEPTTIQDDGLFARFVRRLGIDEKASLHLQRDGETVKVDVPLERTRLTATEARRERNEDFELNVREITFFDRDDRRWDESVQGVLVESAESAGWAGLGGVRKGDLIQEIDGQPIPDIETYREVMKKLAKDQPERVVFVVLRGVRTHYQFIEPEWNPSTDEDTEETPNKE